MFLYKILLFVFIISCYQLNAYSQDVYPLKKQEWLDNIISNCDSSNIELNLKEKDIIKIAEFVLFDKYGKYNIIRQRPYIINKTDKYIIIEGSYRKNTKTRRGTFLIVINSDNLAIECITHYK